MSRTMTKLTVSETNCRAVKPCLSRGQSKFLTALPGACSSAKHLQLLMHTNLHNAVFQVSCMTLYMVALAPEHDEHPAHLLPCSLLLWHADVRASQPIQPLVHGQQTSTSARQARPQSSSAAQRSGAHSRWYGRCQWRQPPCTFSSVSGHCS